MFIVKDGYIYVGVSLLLAAIFTALRLMIPTSCIRLQTVR